MVFRDKMMDYKGELRLVLHFSGKGRNLTSKWHRVKYGLDHFLDHFLDYFLDHLLDHFIGGEAQH